MQIDPKTHMIIAMILTLLMVLAKGAIALPMGIPPEVGQYVTSWSNFAVQIYLPISGCLAGYSSSLPGPFAPPDSPAVKAATDAGKVNSPVFAMVVAVAVALAPTACQKAQNDLTKVDAAVTKYGPIVGKDLVMFANILYQVECSPATPLAGAAVANILNVVAPNSTAASKFQARVTQNDNIAAQLCPLVASVKVAIGQVPAGTPSQTIAAAPAVIGAAPATGG